MLRTKDEVPTKSSAIVRGLGGYLFEGGGGVEARRKGEREEGRRGGRGGEGRGGGLNLNISHFPKRHMT